MNIVRFDLKRLAAKLNGAPGITLDGVNLAQVVGRTEARRPPIIGTSALTQAEMASAMAKASRLGWVDEAGISQAWQDFLSHWAAYTRLPASSGIVERAASIAWRHNLRAYDALHLSSALTWKEVTGDPVAFACYDQNLLKAARQEGLLTWPD